MEWGEWWRYNICGDFKAKVYGIAGDREEVQGCVQCVRIRCKGGEEKGNSWWW